jgi:uncharacterized protein (TIGR02284 family)
MEIMTRTSREEEADLIAGLHNLVHACHQSQQTYQASARSAPSAEFTVLFSTLAEEREHAATVVQQALLRLDTSSINLIHTNGRQEPEMGIAVSTVSSSDTLLHRQALLEMCERQDQQTLDQYEHLLQLEMPADIAALLRQQHNEVAAALLAISKWKPLS